MRDKICLLILEIISKIKGPPRIKQNEQPISLTLGSECKRKAPHKLCRT
jgi:hypothetical protein